MYHSLLFFKLFCGLFVIQPLGAIPEGVTFVYWRNGLNIPFIASAHGMLDASGAGHCFAAALPLALGARVIGQINTTFVYGNLPWPQQSSVAHRFA